jgi:hypothetical protein
MRPRAEGSGWGGFSAFILVAALLFRFPGLPTFAHWASPASSALAAGSRAISTSISAMILFIGGIITAGVLGFDHRHLGAGLPAPGDALLEE